MATSLPYPVQLDFRAERRVARWRPLVQWILAVPHLLIANALSSLRNVLTLISFFTVLFTKKIPRPLFDTIAMIHRYEWRTISYALFLHDDFPPFDFQPAAADDGLEPHTALSFTYPEELSRWQPLYKWFLAVPHYVVLVGLFAASAFAMLFGFFAVLFTGRSPVRTRDFVVDAYRYSLRVQSYVGLLTDSYPPFRLSAR